MVAAAMATDAGVAQNAVSRVSEIMALLTIIVRQWR
jgi:hypothetical protein